MQRLIGCAKHNSIDVVKGVERNLHLIRRGAQSTLDKERVVLVSSQSLHGPSSTFLLRLTCSASCPAGRTSQVASWMRLVSSAEYSIVPEAASLVLRTSRCASERPKTHHNRNSHVKSEHVALSQLQRPRRPRHTSESAKTAQVLHSRHF